MPVDVVLPELGESITEAILVEWLKSDGDAVAVDESLAVIETDKADVELPAPSAGVLQTLKADGDTIQVGETLATIDEAGEAAPEAGQAETAPSEAGEAKDADVGIAAGAGKAIIFRKGEKSKIVKEDEMLTSLIEEIKSVEKEMQKIS